MSGPDFVGLLKEHKEKEAKAVLRAAGGDLGSVSCKEQQRRKKHQTFLVLFLGGSDSSRRFTLFQGIFSC